ncbi:MAG: TlpA disulfide reductase family protein [Catalinimonas sp.]
MSRKEGLGKEVRYWAVWLVVVGGLYLTGRHVPLSGYLQQGLLAVGLWRAQPPSTPAPTPPVRIDGTLRRHEADTSFAEPLEHAPGQTLFVNVWASWCPPCLAEMPGILGLRASLAHRDDVRFLIVSVDEAPARAARLWDRRGWPYPYHRAEALPAALRVSTLPTTFVIGPDGGIHYQHAGPADYDTDAFREFLTRTASKAPAAVAVP